MKRLSVVLTLLVLSGIAPVYAATDASSSSVAVDLFKVVLALIAVLAMMGAAVWMLKRLGVTKSNGDRTVKIVGGVSVGNRERVLVIEVADQWIVVGVAPGRVASLATMPRQEHALASETTPATGNFSAWLKQTIDKRNAK